MCGVNWTKANHGFPDVPTEEQTEVYSAQVYRTLKWPTCTLRLTEHSYGIWEAVL